MSRDIRYFISDCVLLHKRWPACLRRRLSGAGNFKSVHLWFLCWVQTVLSIDMASLLHLAPCPTKRFLPAPQGPALRIWCYFHRDGASMNAHRPINALKRI